MSINDAKAVELALSRDRLSTYLVMRKARSTEQAIRLYIWNAQVSGVNADLKLTRSTPHLPK